MKKAGVFVSKVAINLVAEVDKYQDQWGYEGQTEKAMEKMDMHQNGVKGHDEKNWLEIIPNIFVVCKNLN